MPYEYGQVFRLMVCRKGQRIVCQQTARNVDYLLRMALLGRNTQRSIVGRCWVEADKQPASMGDRRKRKP
jgi:hypothetical protein